ncbi:MAG: MoaD/ThiS family protein [Actinomycetota bacterium]|nr:MoaD/ThiS family protein [Actinomycetota bacterium]
MSVRVKIPTQLRTLTGGAQEVPASGSTVAEVVADLETQHPGMRERLMDSSGSLRRFVNVYIDDEDVRFLQGLDTEVGDGARMSIIPAVAGGSSSAPVGRRAESTGL